MIQETLDYLLIKGFFVNTPIEKIIQSIEDKETFRGFVKTISRIMQTEDFFMILDVLGEKVADFIQHYRFDYNHDKEINEEMNFIISRLVAYKNMSKQRKDYLIREWYLQEIKDREIPYSCQDPMTIFNMIAAEGNYILGIVDDTSNYEIDDFIGYSSFVNLLRNRYPEILEEHYILEVFRSNCQAILELKGLTNKARKVVTKSLTKLNKQYPFSEDVQVELKYEVQKIKKETKN